MAKFGAAIVSASLHAGKHEPEMVKLVKGHLNELQQIPTLFLSVSLSERTVEDPQAPAEKRAQAEADVARTIDSFLKETGWRPSNVAAVAGALLYSKYNFEIRFIMKRIAGKALATRGHFAKLRVHGLDQLDLLVAEFVESASTSKAKAAS